MPKDMSRRSFLATGTALGLSGAVGKMDGFPVSDSRGGKERRLPQEDSDGPPGEILKVLILGGTSFLGPHQVRYALERGHRVSIFTRGRTEPKIFTELFDRVEHLIGDRSSDLSALRGRRWDVVIDNSGQDVEGVRDSANLLADSCDYYLFVSSTGVFYPYLEVGLTEKDEPPVVDDPPREKPSYGVMKALSEREVQRAFGDGAIIVRPNYIVGPGDTTDRFPYWPVRISQGGEVLVPGEYDDPVQFIDVRDLTEWMIHLLEWGRTGVFNAAGPFPTQAAIAEMVYGIRAVTTEAVEWVWIPDYDFLREMGVGYMVPWVMPRGNSLGHTRVNYAKAVANGLTYRPLATTVRDTLEWWASDAVSPERRAEPDFVLTREEERRIVSAWRDRR